MEIPWFFGKGGGFHKCGDYGTNYLLIIKMVMELLVQQQMLLVVIIGIIAIFV